jgi:hypothetical protein
MRQATSVLLTVIGAAVLAVGCANQKQWSDWEHHSTHFASGDHMWFSLTHQGEKAPPAVTRQDLTNARGQSWWGDQVAVRSNQVSQR